MRITASLVAVAIWLVSAPDEEHWGYELTENTGVQPGALYPLLSRLLKAGWLEDRWEDAEAARVEGRPRRRLYRLTETGLAELGAVRRKAATDPRFVARPVLGI